MSISMQMISEGDEGGGALERKTQISLTEEERRGFENLNQGEDIEIQEEIWLCMHGKSRVTITVARMDEEKALHMIIYCQRDCQPGEAVYARYHFLGKDDAHYDLLRELYLKVSEAGQKYG